MSVRERSPGEESRPRRVGFPLGLSFLLLGALGGIGRPAAAADRALIIGIQSYSARGDGWWDLEGPRNDVDLVQAILVDRLGFAPDHIRTLWDREATRRAVVAAMEQLVRETSAGDRVYIHYSGHGSSVVDANGDEGGRRKDSTLVPIDGGARGDYQILDDEIHLWIDRLLRKTPQVVLIVDACHSGTISRDTRSLKVRGLSWSDPRSYAWSDTLRESLRQAADAPPAGFIRISACRDDQEAHEFAGPDAKVYGLLTWAWCRALLEAGPDDTFGDVFQVAAARIERLQGRSQNPQLEGQTGAFLFPPEQVLPGIRRESPLFAALHAELSDQSLGPWKIRVLSTEEARAWEAPMSSALEGLDQIHPVHRAEAPDLILAIETRDQRSQCRFLNGSEQPWGAGRVSLPLLSVSLLAPEDVRVVRRNLSRLYENETVLRLADVFQDSLRAVRVTLEGLVPLGPGDDGKGARCFAKPPSLGRCDRCFRPRAFVEGTSTSESTQLPASARITFRVRNPLDRPLFAYLVNLPPDGRLETFARGGSGSPVFRVPARDSVDLVDAVYELEATDAGLIDTYFCFLSPVEDLGWNLERGPLWATASESMRSGEDLPSNPLLDRLLASTSPPLRGAPDPFPVAAIRRFSILVVP